MNSQEKPHAIRVDGKLLMQHKDIMELIQYVDSHYDMEKKEGLQLQGEHILQPDKHLVVVSQEVLDNYREGWVKYNEVVSRRNKINLNWDYFARLCLVIWFVMMIATTVSVFIK